MSYLCSWVVSGSDVVHAVVLTDIQPCTVGFISAQKVDYVSLSTLGTLFQQYFAFDEALFAEVVGWSLVSFAIGHGLGRMMQVWRKGF